MASGGQIQHMLRSSAGVHVSVVIRKAHHGVCIPDVHPLWILSRRIESNSVRPLQASSEYLRLLRLPVGSDAAKDPNATGTAFREENISVRSGAHKTWLVQSAGELLNFETRRRFGPDVGRARNDIGAVVGRLRDSRGQIMHSDLVCVARLLVAKI